MHNSKPVHAPGHSCVLHALGQHLGLSQPASKILLQAPETNDKQSKQYEKRMKEAFLVSYSYLVCFSSFLCVSCVLAFLYSSFLFLFVALLCVAILKPHESVL